MNKRDIQCVMDAVALRRARVADRVTGAKKFGQEWIMKEAVIHDAADITGEFAPGFSPQRAWADFLAHCKRGEEILNTHRLVYGPRCGNTMPPQIPDGAVVYTISKWGWEGTTEMHRAVALVPNTTE